MGDGTVTVPVKRSRAKSKRKKAKATVRKSTPSRFNLDEISSRLSERPEGRGVPPKMHVKQMQVLETADTDRASVEFALGPKDDPKLFIREFRRGLRRHRKGVKMFSSIRPGNVVLLWVAKATPVTPVAPTGNGRIETDFDEPEDGPDKGAREADARDAVTA